MKKKIIQVFSIIIISIFITQKIESDNIIIDSNMSFRESIKGTKAPKKIIDELVLLDVMYYSMDDKLHRGQILISKQVEAEIKHIFEIALNEKFPIKKCVPIVQYNWSDYASMADNNTSSFNYRKVSGSNNLSRHSYGLAIDINPMNNPVVYKNNKISPKGAKYNVNVAGTLSKNSNITKELKKYGWKWGGDFNSFKDYHHFQK